MSSLCSTLDAHPRARDGRIRPALSVDPQRQKSGVGRQLSSAAEPFARESCVGEMDLTLVNLRTELHPFYGKLGYRIVGTETPRPELASRANRPVHLIRMSKPLI